MDKFESAVEGLEYDKFQVAIFLELMKLNLSIDDICLSFCDICIVSRDNPKMAQGRLNGGCGIADKRSINGMAIGHSP